MSANFWIVAQQVFILFLMILTGYICTKLKFFSDQGIKDLTKFILHIVIPCVIINSFHRQYDETMMKGLLLSLLAAVIAHLLNIAVAHIFIRDKDQARRAVLQFGLVFSNCGYMALPLQNALLGADGVFFGAAYNAIYNIFNWTYGLVIMNPAKEMKLKKVLLNPGIIGVFLGLVFFLTPLKLPQILLAPVQGFAALNTPLPMVVIGYYLCQITSFAVLKDKMLSFSVFLRLIFLPLLTGLVLYLCSFRSNVLLSAIISAAAPSGANTVMFSVMYGRDSKLAVTMVSITTFFSIITMPLIVALTMNIM